VLVPAVLLGNLYFGSSTALLYFLCGRPLVAEYSGELGDMPPGSVGRVAVTLRNLTYGEMEISGARASCSCVESISPDLPHSIPPHASRKLEILINLPISRSGADGFRETVVFYVNGGQQRAAVDISGRVMSDGENGDSF
jgi:hypothetical protein